MLLSFQIFQSVFCKNYVFLHRHNMTIKIRIFILIQCIIWSTDLFRFVQNWLRNVLDRKQLDQLEQIVAFSLSYSFMTLTFFRSVGQLLCPWVCLMFCSFMIMFRLYAFDQEFQSFMFFKTLFWNNCMFTWIYKK